MSIKINDIVRVLPVPDGDYPSDFYGGERVKQGMLLKCVDDDMSEDDELQFVSYVGDRSRIFEISPDSVEIFMDSRIEVGAKVRVKPVPNGKSAGVFYNMANVEAGDELRVEDIEAVGDGIVVECSIPGDIWYLKPNSIEFVAEEPRVERYALFGNKMGQASGGFDDLIATGSEPVSLRASLSGIGKLNEKSWGEIVDLATGKRIAAVKNYPSEVWFEWNDSVFAPSLVFTHCELAD